MNTTENNTNKPSKGALRLAFAINIAELLCGIAGIVTFYNDSSLYHIFGGAILVLRVVEIFLGHQITMSLIACVIGSICLGNIWNGICIGLSFEAVFSTVLAYIIVIITKIKGPVVVQAKAEELVDEESEESDIEE